MCKINFTAVNMEDLTGDQWHQTSFATEDITFYGYMGINKCNYLYFGTAVQQWGQQHSAFYTMLVKFYSWTYALRSCLYYFRCYYTKVICFVFGIDVYRTIKSTRVSSRPCRLYPNNLPIFFFHIVKLFEGWLMEDLTCLEKHWSYTNRCWDTS